MSDPQTKRLRFDSTAISPADSASTPLATARQSFKTAVASLQPELASILDRLANELLLCLHRKAIKNNQVSEYEDDAEKVPRSAKQNFDLKGSKLIEKDEEFLSLCSETNQLVLDFRMTLKQQIV